MDLKEYEHYADACFRDTPPPCSSVCPFGLDVREFVKLLQRGNYRGAYRAYQKTVLFPQIVSALCPAPCGRSCVRGQHDRSIDLKALEAACIRGAGNLQPTRYSRMKKNKRVAVVGGGLSGLACAHRLSSWGYPVTIYEKENTIGGSALREMDPEVCRAELEREFSILDCQFVLGQEITDLAALAEDAVYVATGAGGNDFPSASRPGVYLGGRLAGAAGVESIVHGLQAARAIDNYFRSGKPEPFTPSSAATEPDQRYYRLPYDYEAVDAQTIKGEAEAGRCMLCNCHQCYDVCPVMQKDNRYPKRMCSEVIVTLKPNMSVRTGVRMINNCTFCGKCAEACPVGIDMGDCLDNARRDFYDSGALPPAFHDYWLQDMDFSLSEEAYLVWRPDAAQKSDLVFFPGCQLGASMPEHVSGTYELLRKHSGNAALYLSCCGLPARWAGMADREQEVARQIRGVWEELGRPVFITACTSCLASLQRSCPEIETISLYQWLAEHEECLPAPQPSRGETLQILDPCASAKDPAIQQMVRKLVERSGYSVGNTEANTGCCGFGGHMYAVDPELFTVFADRRIEDVEGPSVTYCANCRDIFAARGADCRHILDLLLGTDTPGQRPPELQARRANRSRLKQMFDGKEVPMEHKEYPLEIPAVVLDKMNEQMLLRNQVAEVIRCCEESGNKLYDEENDLYYGHGRFGTVTIWAAYRLTDGRPVLENVYSHRVDIKEQL